MKSLLILLFYASFIFSQSDVPLTLHKQFNGQYGYTIIGNTQNEFDNYQNPPPPCQMLTQSSATLNLLPNQNIVGAYLYWSGIGVGNQQLNPKLNNISIIPDLFFTANLLPQGFPPLLYFTNLIDITSQIQLIGNSTYTFTDFNLNPIINQYCGNGIYFSGWNIVIIYEDLMLTNKQLNIYQGLKYVGYDNVNSINVLIDNLNIVDNQSAQMTYIAWNGSPNLFSNESINFNGNTLSNATNPANNPFNGTNSFTGTTNNWNQDIDTFDISQYINIGDTQANIALNSIFIRFISTVVTSIRSELPDATVQFTQVTGQEICNNRDLTVFYNVANTNSNAVLQVVPVSFYANNVLVQTINTTSSIAVGGNLQLQTNITIPANIPNTFDLKIIVDNSTANISTIPESNENNNDNIQNINLLGNTIAPTFSLANTFCAGATVSVLPTTSSNAITGTWLPSVISNQNNGSYVFTPNAGQCATGFTLNTTISPSVTPIFSIANTFCAGATVPSLPLTSNNSIAGTWSPSVISNQNSGSYVFTPNAGQCATGFTLSTTISPLVTPTFNILNTFCQGATVPILTTISINNVAGTWSPSFISNQNNGSYVFTPNANQCATGFTLNTTIQIPTFSSENLFICKDNLGETLEPLLLESKLNSNNFSFAWTLNSLYLNQNTNSISVTSEGGYQAIATSNNGDCQQIFNFNVTSLQPILADYFISDDFDLNQTISIAAFGGSGQYLYSFNNLPFQSNAVFETFESGEILVKVKDDSNCYEISKLITVWQYPRFFTPNGDGINNTWAIKTKKPITINIYDRFGRLLQELQSGESWNCTFNSQLLFATDYWFVIYYDENKTFRGHFALLR